MVCSGGYGRFRALAPAAPQLSAGKAGGADVAGHDALRQLINLRWLAAAGQLATILLTHFVYRIPLPLAPMLGVLAGLVTLNVMTTPLLVLDRPVANSTIFAALLLDVAALATQLWLSGGATNPFVSLFLLQVVLGSILLDRWSSWTIVGATCFAFALLTVTHRPLMLPPELGTSLFLLYVKGSVVCFALIAVLFVLFVTRITQGLRARDARLAEAREQATEREHIVRIGTFASGAAHELGTPLSTLSVILGDWRRVPVIAADPDLVGEVEEMQAEVQRCKAIVTGILLSSGDARGEGSAATTVRGFFERVVADWREARGAPLGYTDRFGRDIRIASDAVLQQAVFNLLDNAAEVAPDGFEVQLTREDEALVLTVADRGPGFAEEALANLGRPYNSTKTQLGRGLGLFLVGNVARTLGGTLTARNREGGGAEVELRLPIAALALEENG
jgi:two-component system sensor histidine kinase RegB